MLPILDFDQLARKWLKVSERPLAERVDYLTRACPGIIRQIQQDRGRSGPFSFWGRSLNHDEMAGETIVPASLLETLAAVASVRTSPRTPHAGLQHTYGYLFSSIQTPYGKKRDRWVDDSLELAFQQAPDTFSPIPPWGTLLANVTWLAGQFAFRGEPRLIRLQKILRERVHPALLSYPWEQHQASRLVETIHWKTRTGTRIRVQLVTDLVKLPEQAARLNSRYLLIYSVRDSRAAHPQLITLFPVSDAVFEELRKRGEQSRKFDIRPRYNAHIPGFPAGFQTGSCRWSDGSKSN